MLQGLSLPALIHRLGIGEDGAEEEEELRARLVATKAALSGSTRWPPRSGRATTRSSGCARMYEYRNRRFAARAGKIEDDGYEDRSLAYQQRAVVLAAQREAL